MKQQEKTFSIDEQEPTTVREIVESNDNLISKNNTAGIVGFQACGDEGLPLSTKQEAQPIASGVGG
jgi:hypothetical protein